MQEYNKERSINKYITPFMRIWYNFNFMCLDVSGYTNVFIEYNTIGFVLPKLRDILIHFQFILNTRFDTCLAN